MSGTRFRRSRRNNLTFFASKKSNAQRAKRAAKTAPAKTHTLNFHALPGNTKRIGDRPSLQALIKDPANSQIRVFGGQHSVTASIFPDQTKAITLELIGDFRTVTFESYGEDKQDKFAIVRVGAGCHLGKDPLDWRSTEGNSLNKILFDKGYSLPMLGGITHQTIAGFLATGSAGGSTKYSFTDCIEAITFIDGNGEIITTQRGDKLFNALGVSMGLLGIIIEVTLKVRPTYTVKAEEEIVEIKDSWIQETKSGEYPFAAKILTADYIHLNWTTAVDIGTEKGRVLQYEGEHKDPFKSPLDKFIKCKPYNNPLNIFTAPPAALIFSNMDNLRAQPEIKPKELAAISDAFKQFTPLGKTSNKPYWDEWYKALPTENGVPVHKEMKTEFAEIWIPVEHANLAIKKLKEFYADPKFALGNYAVEMYCARESDFWLSPSYQKKMLRIDPLWWAHNKKNNRQEFFDAFFKKMLGIPGARLHWGKHLPTPGLLIETDEKPVEFNTAFLQNCYPQLNAWLKYREQHDPNQKFLNTYWRQIFSIKPVLQSQLTKNISEEVKTEMKPAP